MPTLASTPPKLGVGPTALRSARVEELLVSSEICAARYFCSISRYKSRCDSRSTSIYKHFNAHCSCERLHYPLLYIARSFPKSVSLFNDKNSSNDGAAQNSTLSQGFKNFYVLRRHVAERWSLAG